MRVYPRLADPASSDSRRTTSAASNPGERDLLLNNQLTHKHEVRGKSPTSSIRTF